MAGSNTNTQVGLALPSRSRVYGTVIGVGSLILGAGLIAPFVVADAGSGREVVIEAAELPEYDASQDGAGGQGSSVGETSSNDASPGPDTTDAGTAGTTPGTTGQTSSSAGSTDASSGSIDNGTSSPGSSPSQPSNTPDPSVPLTASDTGITEETVKLGILAPNQELAGVDVSEATGDIVGLWLAYVAEVNEAGGVSGRQIEPIVEQYDGLSQDAQRAACARLTQDHQVFAVVNAGGFFGDPILCLTEQNRTPAIMQAGSGRDFYQRSNGYYFSVNMEKERTLINFIRRSVADGRFDGHKIAILDREGPDEVAVDNAFVPEMARQGIPITHRSTLSEDFATAQNQIQLEVQEMQRKGVTLVFLATGFTQGATFAQNAEGQGFRPLYAGSDFASVALDVYGATMPQSFDGAYAYTALRTGESRVDLPEAPQDKRCREIAERRTGEEQPRDSGPYVTAVTACGILNLFARGFNGAGPNPTRDTFTAELSSVGTFDGPYAGASSFGPTKWDSPDATRPVQFAFSCKCWTPTGPFAQSVGRR